MAAGPSSGGQDAFQQAHADLLADRGLQFDLPVETPRPPPQTPEWFRALIEVLGPVMAVVFWIGVALAVIALLYFIARELLGARFAGLGWRGKVKLAAEPAAPGDWRPTEAAATVLLADADRLAAEGRYAEAVRLLLLRSIEDIHGHRPRAVKASLTAREIASLDALPASARPAFQGIAGVVERSLFGGAAVDAEDFARCRQDYEAFAFPQGWAR